MQRSAGAHLSSPLRTHTVAFCMGLPAIGLQMGGTLLTTLRRLPRMCMRLRMSWPSCQWQQLLLVLRNAASCTHDGAPQGSAKQSDASAAPAPSGPSQAPFCLCLQVSVRGAGLQAELYSLTSRGGPRYLPRSVNHAAFEVLDALFPAGHRSRRAISLAFRLWFHPLEGPRAAYAAALSFSRLLAWPFVAAWSRALACAAQIRASCWSLLDGLNPWRPPISRSKHA